MEELFLQVLFFLLEVFGDTVLQLAAESLASLIMDGVSTAVDDDEKHPLMAVVVSLIVGAAFGAISAVVVPVHLFPKSRFHGISLLVSPLFTGLFMMQIGNARKYRQKPRMPLTTFWSGSAFGFGFALMRFLFVGRLLP